MTKIQDLQAKRAQLDLDIQSLNEEIAGYEEQIAESKKMRGEEVATFDAALTDMSKVLEGICNFVLANEKWTSSGRGLCASGISDESHA